MPPPGGSSWEKAVGSAPWMASPEERQACPGVTASRPKSSPASHRDLLPWALTVGPQRPSAPSVFLQLRGLGGRAAPAVLCAPSGPAWTPRFRVGWEPADPAGLAEKGTRALWRCRCSWGRCSCLSLLSPFFCVPWCFHSGLTKPGASRMALGNAFPPYPEARPPCLLRSASSLRDIRAVGPPSLSVFKTVYLSGCTRSSLWQVCLVPDQGPSRAPELGAWGLSL